MRAVPSANCKQTEFVNTSWSITAPPKTTREDVLEDAFYSNVAAKLSPYDRILLTTEDGAFYMELLVTQVGRTWAKVRVLKELNLAEDDLDQEVDMFEGFKVEWKGPQRKFSVLRKMDNQYMQDGFDRKEDAYAWLTDYLKAAA
jgi:hypothetical protein